MFILNFTIMPGLIPTSVRWRQENQEFKASLGSMGPTPTPALPPKEKKKSPTTTNNNISNKTNKQIKQNNVCYERW